MKKKYFSIYAGLPKEVYFLFLAKLVNCFGMFIAPLFTLILTQKLGYGKADAGSMVSLLIFTQAPCVLLGGKLADTFGRKKTFVCSLFASASFYMAAGLLPFQKNTVWLIVLAADLMALGAPSSDALVAEFTSKDKRQAAFSFLYLGANIGMAVSPLLGGLLFERHLSLLFLLDGFTSIAAGVILLFFIQKKAVCGAAAAPAGAAPSLAGALKAAPVLLGFIGLLFVYDFCYSQWSFMLPAQFGDLFLEAGAQKFSLLSSANALTVILLTAPLTSLTSHLRPLRAVALGGALFTCAYLGFCLSGPFAGWLFFGELFTLGEICTTVQIGAFLANHTPVESLGRVTAFSSLLRGSASCAGPLVMGWALTAFGYQKSWLLIAAFMAAGALAMFALQKREEAPLPPVI